MTDYVVHEEEYKGLTIKILPDDNPQASDPMDWDMLGKQMYWHRRMNLGHGYKETNKYDVQEWLQMEVVENCWKHLEEDKKYIAWAIEQERDSYDADVDSYIENGMSMKDLWEAFEKYNLVIPVHAYEHGGITISASGRRGGWDSFDSGQLGFVYASHKDILKEFGKKRITRNLLERAEKTLIEEVSTYDDYLTGKVYGYIIENENGEILDSCWGFLGDYKYCLEEAKGAADYQASQIEEELKKLDRRMLD